MLLVWHSVIQMLTLFTFQDFDTLLTHVLVVESSHIPNWVSIFTFPLIKIQFYFEVMSLDMSRTNSVLFSLIMTDATRYRHKSGGKKPYMCQQCIVRVSRICFKVDIYWTFSTCWAWCETFCVLSHEILQLSLGQRGLFLDSFCKGHKGSAVLFNNNHLAPEAYWAPKLFQTLSHVFLFLFISLNP